MKWCCVVLRAGIRLVVMKQPRQGEWARYEAVSAVTRWGCAVDDATWTTHQHSPANRARKPGVCRVDFRVPGLVCWRLKQRCETEACPVQKPQVRARASCKGRAWRRRDGRLTGVDWNLFRLYPNEACRTATACSSPFPPAAIRPLGRPSPGTSLQ